MFKSYKVKKASKAKKGIDDDEDQAAGIDILNGNNHDDEYMAEERTGDNTQPITIGHYDESDGDDGEDFVQMHRHLSKVKKASKSKKDIDDDEDQAAGIDILNGNNHDDEYMAEERTGDNTKPITIGHYDESDGDDGEDFMQISRRLSKVKKASKAKKGIDDDEDQAAGID